MQLHRTHARNFPLTGGVNINMRIVTRYYWILVAPLYLYLAVLALQHCSPVFADGSGPVPSFYWGHHVPAPTWTDYRLHEAAFRRQFALPYWIAGALACALSSLVGSLAARKDCSLRACFLRAAGLCVLLVVCSAAVSDVGISMKWWEGPRFYSYSTNLFHLALLLKLFGMLALMTGILAVGGKLLHRFTPPSPPH